ncbi:MAG: InlB B-repeat-containing protein [Treponema sp.]|nr:InlB B-repeat-containing protein [Treponema sp.]
MKNVFKKVGLLLTFVAAMFFITGCPNPDTQGGDKDKYEVTVYVSTETNATPLKFTVEEGDTLDSLTTLETPSLNGYEFDGFYNEDGTKFSTSTPITSNLTLYARFSKKTTNDNGSTVTETQSADGTQTTTTETQTTAEDGTVTTETTTETKASDGTTTKTEETTVTKKDDAGNETSETTTKTTTTDSNGTTTTKEETTTDVKPNDNTTVDSLIQLGINALVSSNGPNISAAQGYFNAAYAKDSNDDAAKIYSAISDIAAIVTNPKIQKFFLEHLGITNYPSSLNDFITGEWLNSSKYEVVDYERVEVMKLVENDYGYLYKARASKRSEDGALYGYVQGYKTIINGKEYYASEYTKNKLEKLKNYTETRTLFGGGSSSGYDYSYSSDSGYFIPDENGDLLVNIWTSVPKGTKSYGCMYEDIEVPKKIIWTAPNLNSLAGESWFTVQATNYSYVPMLLIGNIVQGNVNGLDSAIDDLYSALFECDEYKNACKKIESIKDGVKLPAEVVNGLGLDKMLGDGSSSANAELKIGKTELKLIESILNILKGTFEYFQAYSFNTNLSFLKTDWARFMDEAKNAEAMKELLDLVKKYNAEIDPIANGFLSVRNSNKMDDSKNTFVAILTDLINSYDSITGTNNYPTVIGTTVKEGAVLRDAAVNLRTAIQNGGKFYIPDLQSVPKTWPTSQNNAAITLDCGKLFKAGQFAIGNLIELDNSKPVFYSVTEDGTTKKISSADDLKALLGNQNANFVMNILATKSLSEVINIPGIPTTAITLPTPTEVVLFTYNFYYGGLEEYVDQLIKRLTEPQQEEHIQTSEVPVSD